jgi:hypothetical protein
MNIAAELSNEKDLHVYLEGIDWAKVILPFEKEKVQVGLIVLVKDGQHIFHDMVNTPNGKPMSDRALKFCQNELSIKALAEKLATLDLGEPYEVRLGNGRIALRKQFTDAYSITFIDYPRNQPFVDWLAKGLPSHEADQILKSVLGQYRYYTKDFAEFKDFKSLEDFVGHRFEQWHAEIVKEFEEGIANGVVKCEGCENE